MVQETRSSFDICDFVSNGKLGEYKLLYENVIDLLNKTKTAGKCLDASSYIKYLDETKNELDNLVCKYDQLIEEEKQGFSLITDICKKKFYQLAGEVYAIFGNQHNNQIFIDKALDYFIKYQVMVQKYKPHEEVKPLDEIIVYSFRRVSKYSLADLVNNTITVCHPSKMNDPFDSLANLWMKSDNLKRVTNDKGHENILEKSMEFYRIRSFIRPGMNQQESDVLEKIIMWSLYANEHRGYCIKYRLKRGFLHDVDTTNMRVRRLAPIDYRPDFAMTKNLTAIDSYKAFNMKHESWNYENEIRLLSYQPSKKGLFFNEPMGDEADILEIIFGIYCSAYNKKRIYNILKDRHIKFFYMATEPEKSIYKLIKKEYIPNSK